jgi:protein-serine/threonine kinase
MPGGDLYHRIHSGIMEFAEINCYFKQLLAGVNYMHTMGVVHRYIHSFHIALIFKN